MFWILIGIGAIAGVFTGIWIFSEPRHRKASIPIMLICIAMIISAWFTPQGHMYWQELNASANTGNWLVIDNSGGKTLRHWILEDSYVQSSDDSDGWKFYDSKGNGPIYVSGDAFVMRINEPLEAFRLNYHELYNVPSELPVLH